MQFCPDNQTFSEVWINHGVSQCFMETITSSVAFFFILITGTAQLIIYKKYADPVTDEPLPCKKSYRLQVALLFCFPILTVLRLILQGTVLNNHTIYGYMILSTLMVLFMYPYSYVILVKERYYQLPSVPAKGHGLVLLGFWTLGFTSENLSFINLRRDEWWFHLKSAADFEEQEQRRRLVPPEKMLKQGNSSGNFKSMQDNFYQKEKVKNISCVPSSSL